MVVMLVPEFEWMELEVDGTDAETGGAWQAAATASRGDGKPRLCITNCA